MTLPHNSTSPVWPFSIVLLLLAFAPAANAIPPDKAVITLTPKFGPVTFSHQRHSELEAAECTTCHHTLETADEPVRSCYSCHKAKYYSVGRIVESGPGTAQTENIEPQIRNAKEAFHDLCIGCHRELRELELPTGPDDSCRDCHK